MRQFKRSDRLREQILRDVSVLLEQDLAELGVGLVTFTHVKLSDDLRYATVYYSSLGDDAKRVRVQQYFDMESRRIRQAIGSQLSIRHIPEFSFKFDPSIEHSVKIEQLLNEIKSQRPE